MWVIFKCREQLSISNTVRATALEWLIFRDRSKSLMRLAPQIWHLLLTHSVCILNVLLISSEESSYSCNKASDHISTGWLDLSHLCDLLSTSRQIRPNQASMFINFIMDVVHADYTCDIIFKAAWSCGISCTLGPCQDSRRHCLVVLVSERISSETFRNEPSCSMSLLSFDNEKLQSHEQDNKHDSNSIRLLVQKVVIVSLEV